MSARSLVLALVPAFVVLLLATQAWGRPGRARVERVAGDVAWLNQGQGDGLVVGAKVKLRRGARRAGTCVVDLVSESWATCRGDVDDAATRARFSPLPLPDPPPVAPAPSLLSRPEVAGRAEAIKRARFSPVPYTTQARARARGWRFPLAVSFVHRTWTRTPIERRTFHRERVEMVLRGARVFVDGLRLHADAAVEGALASPLDARYRRSDPVRVEVRETALSWRPVEGGLIGTVGRFIPWGVVGVTVLDGLQAGYRTRSGALEIGAYAGTHPEITVDVPSLLRASAGAYWGARWLGEGAYVAHRGRVGVRSTPSLALRAELEVDVDTAVGRWLRASAGGRAGVLSESGLDPGIDLAFARARLNVPGEAWIGGGYRFAGPAPLDMDEQLPATVLPPAGRHHADAAAGWDGLGFAQLGLSSGGAQDVVSGDVRAYVGPDLTFPRALLGVGGVSLSYREELGAWAGRSFWSRVYLDGFDGLRLSSTAMVYEDAAPIEAHREVQLSARGDAQVLRWLSVGARARGQVALPSVAERPTAQLPALVGELTLTGSL